MRRGASRKEIIRTTQTLIVRNGIRAVRVDEIAQTLGISKRTLYETFADKTALVNSCLEDLGCRRRRKVSNHMRHKAYTSLQKVFWLMNEYLTVLQMADRSFLADLQNGLLYADSFEQDRQFWEQTLNDGLLLCKADGYVLHDTECDKVARQLMHTLLKLRLDQTPEREQRLFCRTILRGIATQSGIAWIDAQR